MAGYPVAGEQREAIDAKVAELRRQLSQKVGCPVDPKWINDALQAIVEGRGFSGFLIHGMFLPTDLQLELVKRLNLERGWGFSEEDFVRLGPAPVWPSDSKLGVVILDVSLDDAAKTFETAWELIKSVQPSNWHWDQLSSDAEHLRLLSGKHQRGLRWRIVDLAVNQNAKPIDVGNADTSPNSEILWMAFYSPKWVQAMDGIEVPYVWVPGYEVSIPGCRSWAGVPARYWRHDDREVKLSAHDAGDRNRRWAVPVRRECPK